MKSKNIILFGGAFDPVTIAHVEIAQLVINKLEFDELWFLPCYRSVWGKKMLDPYERLGLLRIALDTVNDKRLLVSDRDITKKSSGYTIDTIHSMIDEYKEHTLYFLIGMDQANLITSWKGHEALLGAIKFIVTSRTGVARNTTIDWYIKEPHMFLEFEGLPEASSTQARKELKENWFTKLIYPKVYKRIYESKAYGILKI